MIVKTLETGWHDAKPIYSCDFQRRSTRTSQGAVCHKFATAGADTHIRIWLIHPMDPNASSQGERSPRAEHLSTLAKHAGAVNVVRWSPDGELIASGADDGMLIIWTREDKPQTSIRGRDTKDISADKEAWRVLSAIRVTAGEVYDLAWSPTGEYILTGSTDNTARIFSIADNTCVREIVDHNHYVQGVSWDPMNEYIATQSSDRSVKLYSISIKSGSFEAHAVSSNSRVNTRQSRRHQRTGSTASASYGVGSSHSRAPSATRPSTSSAVSGGISGGRKHVRRSSISSEASSISMATNRGEYQGIGISTSTSGAGGMEAPLTPATSTTSGVGGLFLQPSSSFSSSKEVKEQSSKESSVTPIKEGKEKEYREYREPRTATTSRRSSFSGSQAPGSPASFRGRGLADDRESRSSYGRSPSPMPPLPAVRTPHSSTGLPAASWAQAPPLTPSATTSTPSSWLSTRFYGDESPSSFFRRLTFSPDGDLLFTPAGWFEDPSVNVNPLKEDGEDVEKEKEKESHKEREMHSSQCVYVYSKANFSKSPVAAYPGHKRPVLCVKFSHVLYELRPNTTPTMPSAFSTPANIALEPGKEDMVDVNFSTPMRPNMSMSTPISRSDVALPSPTPSVADAPTPSQTPKKLPTDFSSGVATPGPNAGSAAGSGEGAASAFNLPYRMMFAVATQDTVAIHDTQQAGPICLLNKLHYDSFTDMAWSADGHVLMLVSSDGYCTVVVFDENLPTYQTQQRDLQLRSVALAHSHSLISSSVPQPSPHVHYHASVSSNQSQPSAAQSPLVQPALSPFAVPPVPSPSFSLKELPGPSAHNLVPQASSGVKRPASSFDPPLTPAASVIGGDSETGGPMEIDKESEAFEDGPARKRRRVGLERPA